MSSSGNKRQHAEMMDSLFKAIHEDDSIETAVLQGVAATLTEVLEESSNKDEQERTWGGLRPGKAP